MTDRQQARDPGSVNELRRRIGSAARARGSTVRRLQSFVASIALCQMLPPSAVKGGTGLKLRLGDAMTRQTPDLDTAFRGDLTQFHATLAENLAAGWGGFTGTVIELPKRPPIGVPNDYVMQPYRVKLQFRVRPFATVDVEVGYDELEATTREPVDHALPEDALDLFAEIGLTKPLPVPVLPLHHQIAQKLHACTEPGNQRAHDLVDIQMCADQADDALVARTVRRLFTFRGKHAWPAVVAPDDTWAGLYATAADGLPVAATVTDAAQWVNDYIARLADYR